VATPRLEPASEISHDEPSFHVYASEWVASRRPEVDERTTEYFEWALSGHLLPYFKDHRPSEITPQAMKAYRAHKLAAKQPLSASSLNKTLKVLAQILDDAIEDGYLATNPARGKRARVRAPKPKRTWLELDEVTALLDSAGAHRALLETMILAGLRVSELCALRWRAVDLARGRLSVEDSKTDAGRRTIELSPLLLDELKAHKASARHAEGDELVFPTRYGTQRDRANVRARVLTTTIERANAKARKAGRPGVQAGVTNHTLRRTFASLLYEAGASPAFVMAQMGHESAALALEVYSKVMERKRDTGERMDALVRGADWAQTGTNGAKTQELAPALATRNSA
jgi:integrase